MEMYQKKQQQQESINGKWSKKKFSGTNLKKHLIEFILNEHLPSITHKINSP